MKEVKLAYRGKQSRVVLTCLPVCRTLTITGEEFWVCEEDAQWLLRMNPKMFEVKATREPGPVDEAPEVVEEVEIAQEKFVCPVCGKKYKDERWFDSHVARCEVEWTQPNS